MQASLTFAAPSIIPISHKIFPGTKLSRACSFSSPRYVALRSAPLNTDTSTVDYNSSPFSVFPAEACETVGGDACLADIYPEVRLQPEASNDTPAPVASENVEREYLEYNDQKTVFPGEACDELGGTFCDPEYQKGVY